MEREIERVSACMCVYVSVRAWGNERERENGLEAFFAQSKRALISQEGVHCLAYETTKYLFKSKRRKRNTKGTDCVCECEREDRKFGNICVFQIASSSVLERGY